MAKYDAGLPVIRSGAHVAGIGQRIARNTQSKELVGFAAIDGIRHDAELGGVETIQFAQETAKLRLDPAGIQVSLRAPGR